MRYSFREVERKRAASAVSDPKSKQKVAKEEQGSSRTYRKYTPRDREDFLLYGKNSLQRSTTSIADSLGIEARTAQRWVREYNEADVYEVPIPKPKGRAANPKLNDTHKDFLISFVDENPSAGIADMMEALIEEFDGLSVSKNTVHRFLKDNCSFSFKMTRKEPVERSSSQKIEQMFRFIQESKEADVDYCKNCVFIGEAEFNTNMKRSQGQADRREKPAVNTVLGAISYHGVVFLSARKRQVNATREKRTARPYSSLNSSRGTTTGHFEQFLIDVMTEMDKHLILKGAYLVMDNASIHKNESIGRIVSAKGYRVLY